jgi:hypothetical protein
MDNKLKLLSQIEAVEAPPFLLTRITQKIENEQVSRFSLGASWALGFSLLLILSLDIAVLVRNFAPIKQVNLAQKMELLPKNDFYNE